MNPSREQIKDWSEDMGDGWVRMPFSAWCAVLDFLGLLESLETWYEAKPNPWPDFERGTDLTPTGGAEAS